ncbi:unnamed protein product [Cuscuta campestris]|uniref:DUF4228 domain-containing protein n=1 Tax=Cuscuta campestris TaxID=132261 RepID=A0A484MHJ7_9ASTE|nr:unnamed protein product [Cuscuta campestris]
MRNAVRCCISCILPCGVLDVIRIVHTNGRVEEINGDVTAAEVMKLHPKHVLKQPSPRSPDDPCRKVVVVPPEAALQRGKIYFLVPALSPSGKPASRSSTMTRKKRVFPAERRSKAASDAASDQYLSEILSEKISTAAPGDRRRGRVGIWRPHLESISETPSEA